MPKDTQDPKDSTETGAGPSPGRHVQSQQVTPGVAQREPPLKKTGRLLVKAWKATPGRWKFRAALIPIGALIRWQFGLTGLIILLLVIFAAGTGWDYFDSRKGEKVRGFASGQIAGVLSGLVVFPLIVPTAQDWWTVIRSGADVGLARAIYYTVAVAALWLLIPVGTKAVSARLRVRRGPDVAGATAGAVGAGEAGRTDGPKAR